eukprot:scaffold3329_cov120-Isochrysis_galbana.AAC.10
MKQALQRKGCGAQGGCKAEGRCGKQRVGDGKRGRLGGGEGGFYAGLGRPETFAECGQGIWGTPRAHSGAGL